MYKEHCLDTYDKCINDIVAPNVGAPTNIDIMKSHWVVYSNNILECKKLFDFCNKHLGEKELEELEREYELLVKEPGTKNSGGYKAKKKSKTKKHSKNKKHYKTKKRSKTNKYYKTKKRYKTNKLSKKCSKTRR